MRFQISKFVLAAGFWLLASIARGQTTSTSSGPATQPSYAQQLSGVGASVDSLIAAKAFQVQAAQQATVDALARLANVQASLDAANSKIADLARLPAASGPGNVPAGTSVEAVINRCHAGEMYVFGPGDWFLNGPVTLSQDNVQLVAMPGAKLHCTTAAGAYSSLIFHCRGSRITGFAVDGTGRLYVQDSGAAGTVDAPGFPPRYPPGNEISYNSFAAGMAQAVQVEGSAWNTLVSHNSFGRMQGDAIFDAGHQTAVIFNSFAGSNGDHSYRQDQDAAGTATNSLLAFNFSDNRTGKNKLEDFTFRSVGGSVVLGNTLMAWSDITSGGSSYWRGNILPTPRPGGAIVQGNSGRARASYYFDQNYLAASQRDAGVTLYASGDLITRNNVIVNPPMVYKQVFATIARDQQTPFDGRQIELGGGNVLTPSTASTGSGPAGSGPATQPSTQPVH